MCSICGGFECELTPEELRELECDEKSLLRDQIRKDLKFNVVFGAPVLPLKATEFRMVSSTLLS